MHAVEGNQRLPAFASHSFQGAAGVSYAIPGETAAHEIRNAALHRDHWTNEASSRKPRYRLRDSGNQSQFVEPLLLQRLN